jgi:NADPH:quinone reductase-like Zn-dependent oxidoreductase
MSFILVEVGPRLQTAVRNKIHPRPRPNAQPDTMPVVQPGSRILVTGGNSYIGVGAIRALLDQGFAVRATVRSKEKNLWLEDLFKEYKDKFELVIVEDIQKVCVCGF